MTPRSWPPLSCFFFNLKWSWMSGVLSKSIAMQLLLMQVMKLASRIKLDKAMFRAISLVRACRTLAKFSNLFILAYLMMDRARLTILGSRRTRTDRELLRRLSRRIQRGRAASHSSCRCSSLDLAYWTSPLTSCRSLSKFLGLSAHVWHP